MQNFGVVKSWLMKFENNHYTSTWDCVGEIPYKYLVCRSVHIGDNKILFIGGVTGTYDPCKDDDIVTTCIMLQW